MTDFPDSGALRWINEADVYKAGVLAGHLRRSGDAVEFLYAESYLAVPMVPPVAFTLPTSAGKYRATGGSVPPFFAGLLPEGLRLSAITSAVRTSEDDHLSLLLAVGRDAIGDVQVMPAGCSPLDPVPVFDRADTAHADFGALFAQVTATNVDEFDRIGLPGVQVKVSAQMISTPLSTSRGPAILKLNPPDHPFLVENESFFLDMAAACGIPVPRHHLATDGLGRTALFVDRFDRVVEGSEVRKLAQEDACQVGGRYPAAKYRITLQEAMKSLAEAVVAGGGSYPMAIVRMLEIAAFSYLIGNGDLHGKNLSIRQNPAGLWEVTPAYDLLTTQPYLSWNDPMALPLYGRDGKLIYRWWIEAARHLGVSERAIKRSLARIVDSSEPWIDRVSDIGFDEKTTRRLSRMISQRHKELHRPSV
ncbi:MAG: HipA domain-containing protein [Mycobacterium sp.]|nr:HipA domain-containing protein [Mycobacterium sp.]